MFEDHENDNMYQDSVSCPICEAEFRDKRRLTSHARNIHDLERDKIFEKNDRER